MATSALSISFPEGLRLRLGGRGAFLNTLGGRPAVRLGGPRGFGADGTKELVAIEDGYRESKESWLSLLRDLKKLEMKAPALATGDGDLGFWGA